ncbi:DNA topoisomerase IB [Nocardioides donggukensis]|uniref:DNA topoisomerase n=1 Tax=Nocardioides donggukensis TaxID=2774019 RepID=A0A927Q245_9ACTN|nr:DNA topoisomerase IB [Nocardioides donggukensis]MBD8870029.1 DNA topoisomerase IB [Nocardioides donggukensis]
MVRLRTVSPNSPGWTRRRAGRGFVYLDRHGERLPDADVARAKELVIPPAWREVWISPHPNAHLQAVGVDEAGRRQYLYHPQWRIQQDELKFERVARAARRLPAARNALEEHLTGEGMPLERSAATAVRLLDLGCFRIGGDAFEEGGSFGLTTLERRHVTRTGSTLVFEFVGKSGIDHRIEVDDPLAVAAVETLRRRRGGSDRLMAFKRDRRWVDLDASDVNDYLRESVGEEITAKDFRTWHATVLAAASLAESDETGQSAASRKRAVRQAMVEVAEFLGNTPAIAKSSYVDPRVIDLYEDGVTIEATTRRRHRTPESRRAALERAVLRMLSDAPSSAARRTRRGAA